MAKAGGRRVYKRDNKGQFSGSSSHSNGPTKNSKAAASRKANSQRAKDLQAKGTISLGNRIIAKGFTGVKSTQKKAGGLRQAKALPMKGKASNRQGTITKNGKPTKGQLRVIKNSTPTPLAKRSKTTKTPKAIRALVAAGVGAYVAGQTARAAVNRMLSRRKRKR